MGVLHAQATSRVFRRKPPLGDGENESPVKLAFWAVVSFTGRGASGRPGDWPPTGGVVVWSFRVLRPLLCCGSCCTATFQILKYLHFLRALLH